MKGFFLLYLRRMGDLDKIVEEAWKHQDYPEVLMRKPQEVFEDFHENAMYLFEYANALDFMGRESEAIPPILNGC